MIDEEKMNQEADLRDYLMNNKRKQDQLDRMEAAIQVNHQLLLHILRKSNELLAEK